MHDFRDNGQNFSYMIVTHKGGAVTNRLLLIHDAPSNNIKPNKFLTATAPSWMGNSTPKTDSQTILIFRSFFKPPMVNSTSY